MWRIIALSGMLFIENGTEVYFLFFEKIIIHERSFSVKRFDLGCWRRKTCAVFRMSKRTFPVKEIENLRPLRGVTIREKGI